MLRPGRSMARTTRTGFREPSGQFARLVDTGASLQPPRPVNLCTDLRRAVPVGCRWPPFVRCRRGFVPSAARFGQARIRAHMSRHTRPQRGREHRRRRSQASREGDSQHSGIAASPRAVWIRCSAPSWALPESHFVPDEMLLDRSLTCRTVFAGTRSTVSAIPPSRHELRVPEKVGGAIRIAVRVSGLPMSSARGESERSRPFVDPADPGTAASIQFAPESPMHGPSRSRPATLAVCPADRIEYLGARRRHGRCTGRWSTPRRDAS